MVLKKHSDSDFHIRTTLRFKWHKQVSYKLENLCMATIRIWHVATVFDEADL